MANEVRLIDANAMMDEVYDSDEKQGNDVWHTGVIEYLVMAQPTVDAAPVVHGRWYDVALRYTEVKEECSVCHGVVRVHGFRYCPNCGAKMDGGEDNG